MHVPAALDGDVLVAAHVRVGVVQLVDAQVLDRAARHAGQARALVDVAHVDLGVVARQVDAVGDHRRLLGGAEGDRLEQGVARQLGEQRDVVEDVDQVDAPRVGGARLAGDQEVLLAQRVGVEEARPAVVDELVLDHRLDLLAPAGDALDHAVGLEAALGRVEEHQLAHARHAVVAGDDGRHHRRVAGDRPGVEQRVRPVGVGAVVLGLPGAVRVHVEQDAGEVVRRVRVLPAGVEDAAVVEHGRAPVVVLVEAQLAQAVVLLVEQEQVGYGVGAADAGNALEDPRRVEDDPAVRQVTGVVVVDRRVGALGQRPQAAAVGAELPDLPPLVLVGHREQHPVGVEVQVDVGQHARRLGPEEALDGRGAAAQRQGHDLVVVAAARQRAVALPVLGQAELGTVGPALDRQQPVEVEQRVVEQRLAAEGLDPLEPGLDSMERPVAVNG